MHAFDVTFNQPIGFQLHIRKTNIIRLHGSLYIYWLSPARYPIIVEKMWWIQPLYRALEKDGLFYVLLQNTRYGFQIFLTLEIKSNILQKQYKYLKPVKGHFFSF